MNQLERILRRYARFEQKVQTHMTARLKRFCAPCEGGCCTAVICRESVESSFLIRLREMSQPRVSYRRGGGWQREHGCALVAGRPPVCYEFICDDIERAHPDPLDRYVLKVLCRLVTYAGKRACGMLHAVEISEDCDLLKIQLNNFMQRLEAAEAAFNRVKAYHAGKNLNADDMEILVRIYPLPPSLKRSRAQWRSRTVTDQ